MEKGEGECENVFFAVSVSERRASRRVAAVLLVSECSLVSQRGPGFLFLAGNVAAKPCSPATCVFLHG
jgi:hypothetical protein